jgi:hypothetical protein
MSEVQQILTTARIHTSYKREKPMDVLWGAWVKQVVYSDSLPETIDIKGIYDTIRKNKKSDYPFSMNLQVVLVYQAHLSESGKDYNISLGMIDIDAVPLLSIEDIITVPEFSDERVIRWYQDYKFHSVVIKQPGYYELSISVNNEHRQHIPLLVDSPKAVDMDKLIKYDIYEERWIEDVDKEV